MLLRSFLVQILISLALLIMIKGSLVINSFLSSQVIVADPSKASTAELIRLLESFMNHNAPFRIGLVIAVDSDESLRGFDDPGLAMLCAFNFISENFAGREDANLKALQFLIDVSVLWDLR